MIRVNNTICYSAINPRPLKKREVVSSMVGSLVCRDKYHIKDVEKEIVEVSTEVLVENEYCTNKMAQSFSNSCGIKAIAKRVAINELGTIYDESGNIVDARNLPANLIEAKDIINAGKSAKVAYDNLPKEITKNMSAEDFVEKYNQADLIASINALFEAQSKVSTTEKKEVKDNE